jgi:hypothetical protein
MSCRLNRDGNRLSLRERVSEPAISVIALRAPLHYVEP